MTSNENNCPKPVALVAGGAEGIQAAHGFYAGRMEETAGTFGAIQDACIKGRGMQVNGGAYAG